MTEPPQPTKDSVLQGEILTGLKAIQPRPSPENTKLFIDHFLLKKKKAPSSEVGNLWARHAKLQSKAVTPRGVARGQEGDLADLG